MSGLFFDGWSSLLRTLIVGVLAYVVLIVFLRVSGKRTLAKMNAFDLVVTVSLGSTLASILISKTTSLAQGALALALLIGLQFAITFTSVRVAWVRRTVTGEPTLLLHRGRKLESAMRRARVTESELEAAARASGLASPALARAIVLETDGSFSVIRGDDADDAALAGVKTPDETSAA